MIKINIPQEAIPFYQRQRCATQKMNHQEIEEFAYGFHFKIFNQFQNYLKPGNRSLDIGCGLGVINIFTGKYFNEIYLLDKTVLMEDLKKVYYGFHGNGFKVLRDDEQELNFCENVSSEYCFYNNLVLAEKVVSPYLQSQKVYTIEPEQLKSLDNQSFDFVQSHMSWGWHFPFNEYAAEVLRILKKDGLLILDVRNNTLSEGDLTGFEVIDKLANRELNSRKYVLKRC